MPLSFLRRAAFPRGADLRHPLLYFSRHDVFCIEDACTGVQITGQTGSGKTTTSGRTLGLAYLEAGFGGLILTTKPEDRRWWETTIAAAGRRKDLVIVDASGQHRLNLLAYEASRARSGTTENLLHLLQQLLAVRDRGSAGTGKGEDPFWARASEELLRALLEIVALAQGGRVTIPDLYRALVSAPQSPEQVQAEGWQQGSFLFSLIVQGEQRTQGTPQAQDFAHSATYWLSSFPQLADRTRSILVTATSSLLDGFMRGLMRELWSTDTTFTPEDTFAGKLILLDLPIKTLFELGQLSQIAVKVLFQRAVERRDVQAQPRPVMLWADEAHFFLIPRDLEFQTTARSSRVCTVYLTQSLNNYYAVLGGEGKARAEVDGILANLATKVFHTCDPVTAQYAADLIGKDWTVRGNASVTQSQPAFFSPQEARSSLTGGGAQSLEHLVTPRHFTLLRKPSMQDGRAEAIVFQGGRTWHATGTNWLPVTFTQKG